MLSFKKRKNQNQVKVIKTFLIVMLGIFFASVLITGCKKDSSVTPKVAHIKVKIDYLTSGGYYNDNIDGIPTGLVVGVNGPFDVDPSKKYYMEYKAGSNWNVARIDGWSPTTTVTWIIHCYIQGNIEHIETYPE